LLGQGVFYRSTKRGFGEQVGAATIAVSICVHREIGPHSPIDAIRERGSGAIDGGSAIRVAAEHERLEELHVERNRLIAVIDVRQDDCSKSQPIGVVGIGIIWLTRIPKPPYENASLLHGDEGRGRKYLTETPRRQHVDECLDLIGFRRAIGEDFVERSAELVGIRPDAGFRRPAIEQVRDLSGGLGIDDSICKKLRQREFDPR
jgi:hypothetical protein